MIAAQPDRESLNLIDWIQSFCNRKGVEQIALTISRSHELGIDVHRKRPERVERSESKTLTISIYHQQRYSIHTTNDFQPAALSSFLEKAIEQTAILDKDPDRALPDPALYPPEEEPDLQSDDQQFEKIDPEEIIANLQDAEKEALQFDRRIVRAFISYTQNADELIKYHSNGLLRKANFSSYSYQIEVVCRDRGDARPADWSEANSVWKCDLPELNTLVADASRRTVEKIGPQKLPSGNYQLLVENRVASRLLSSLISPLSGRLLYLKASCLEKLLEKQIASPQLTINENPFQIRGLSSRLFDEEGLGAKRRTLYAAGVLKNYLLGNYYSRKLNLPPNSASLSNLEVCCGKKSCQQLIAEIDRGIMITDFLGGNQSNISGDFSLGISGFYIEGGRVRFPISEMVLSGNLLNFFQNLVATGNDPYRYSSFQSPSLLFSRAALSGI